MCKCVLPPGVNQIAVDKYINPSIPITGGIITDREIQISRRNLIPVLLGITEISVVVYILYIHLNMTANIFILFYHNNCPKCRTLSHTTYLLPHIISGTLN
jgi:hypothetical protein